MIKSDPSFNSASQELRLQVGNLQLEPQPQALSLSLLFSALILCSYSSSLLDIQCAFSYVLGSLLYIVGSVLFLPSVNRTNAGAWTYVVGSVLFVVGAITNSAKLIKEREKTDSNAVSWWVRVSYVYIWGSIAFFFGSIFFLPVIDDCVLGAWFFIFGSGLFVIGVLLDVLELYKLEKEWSTRYALVAGIMNILGSLVFMLASVPYVIDLSTIYDIDKVYEVVAILFLLGTFCFLSGGFIALVQACFSK